MKNTHTFWTTAEGVAAALGAAIALLFVFFLFAWLMYEENSDREFGLSPDLVVLVAASYGGTITMTFTNCFRVFLRAVREVKDGTNTSDHLHRLSHCKLIYAFALTGWGLAFGALVWASFDPPPDKAKILVGVVSISWALTMGVSTKFLSEAFYKDDNQADLKKLSHTP